MADAIVGEGRGDYGETSAKISLFDLRFFFITHQREQQQIYILCTLYQMANDFWFRRPFYFNGEPPVHRPCTGTTGHAVPDDVQTKNPTIFRPVGLGSWRFVLWQMCEGFCDLIVQ